MMRSFTLKTLVAISLVAILAPRLAFATSPSFSCSTNLVVSLDNGYSASCDGDFAFTDGVLQNDTKISLTAGGFLNIGASASLIAPLVNLYSTNIFISNGATIGAAFPPNVGFDGINLDAGKGSKVGQNYSPSLPVVINSGSSISLAENRQPNGLLTNGALSDVGGNLLIGSTVGFSTNPVQNINASFTLISAVPKPLTYAMMMLGLGFIGLARAHKTH